MTIFHEIIDQLRVADTAALLGVVATEHRTNQQLLAKNVLSILKHWSDEYEAGNYDARNEVICTIAHDMVSGSEELSKYLVDGEFYLPYI